jgi:hypothetical protein
MGLRQKGANAMVTEQTLSGYVHVEFWGAKTSNMAFANAQRLTSQTGGTVTARTGYDAPNDLPGEDEACFTFNIDATAEQFRAFCDGMRACGWRVKSAMLGQPEEGDDYRDEWDDYTR